MDPAKLKVVELRAELAALGLDTRGNKPALVDRLKAALASGGQAVVDTTIADTSTEEIDETGGESPPRRPGPAIRTRRRQSSSEPPPTPTRSSRRETATSIQKPTQPAIVETEEARDVFSIEDSGDSNQETIAVEASKIAETTKPQVSIVSSPVKQQTPVKLQPSPVKEQTPVKEVTPVKLESSPVKEQTPVKVTPLKLESSPVKEQTPVKTQPTSVISQSIPLKEQTPTKLQSSPIKDQTVVKSISSPVKDQTTLNPEPSPIKVQSPIKPQQVSPKVELSHIKETPANVPIKTSPEKHSDVTQKISSPIKEQVPVCLSVTDRPPSATEILQPELKTQESEPMDVSTEQSVKEAETSNETSIGDTMNSENVNDQISDGKTEEKLNESSKEDKKEEEDPKKDRKRREKHSRWSSSNQNDSVAPDNDVQVTGEYISIRDDDDDKNRGRNKRNRKRLRPPSPRRKSPVRVPEPEIPQDKVTVSWYDSDLNLRIDVPDMNVAIPFIDGAFAHCWAGARSSHGITQGKICYEVRIESMITPPENCVPGIRFGWSTADSSLHLGESKLSWAFEHSGRKVNDGNFESYGVELKEKDVVGAYIDLESTPCTISYTVNGESQGTAFEFDKDTLEEAAIFPHILSRNCCYRVNYGHEKYNLLTKTKVIKQQIDTPTDCNKDKDAEDSTKTDIAEKDSESEQQISSKTTDSEQEDTLKEQNDESNNATEEKMDVDESEKTSVDTKESSKQIVPKETIISIEIDGEEAKMVEGYTLIGHIPFDQLVSGPQKPTEEEQCEVIMMCGLPGSGKTYWSQKYVSEHPDKRFNILGTNALIEKMKIDCKPFKTQYDGKWKMLISKVTKCVVKLIEIAQSRRRNYVLDQTNVYPSAQRRKLREFNGYKRTAVVIVPDETVFEERQRLREEKDGKDVPDGAVLEMKANFVLPEKCSWLDEVIFAELDEEAAKKLLEKYNKEGRAAEFNNNSGSGSLRPRSAGRSSSGGPIAKRSRFDNGPSDRGRFRGPDRGRHNIGPIRNRDSRRGTFDRRGGGNWGGRPGGWGGGRDWSGPRDHQPYGRDHPPYGGRDAYNREPFNRDRNRDGPPGMHPYRGVPDRWVNRGAGNHRGRDNRGGGNGMDGRGRGNIMDRGRHDGNDRTSGGAKSTWTGTQQNRGGHMNNANTATGAVRNQQGQFNRGQRNQNTPGGQTRNDNQGGGNWAQQGSGGWNQQQQGGNWNQGGWSQGYQQGWSSGGWGNAGSGGSGTGAGQWGKFPSQQATGGQQQSQQQQQQQGQQQGQWGQWNQWQQSYWPQQWNVQQGYGTTIPASNPSGTVANQEKK